MLRRFREIIRTRASSFASFLGRQLYDGGFARTDDLFLIFDLHRPVKPTDRNDRAFRTSSK